MYFQAIYRLSSISATWLIQKVIEVDRPVESGQQFMVVGHGEQRGVVGRHALEQEVHDAALVARIQVAQAADST